MNRLKLYAIFFALSLTLLSCNKDKDDDNPNAISFELAETSVNTYETINVKLLFSKPTNRSGNLSITVVPVGLESGKNFLTTPRAIGTAPETLTLTFLEGTKELNFKLSRENYLNTTYNGKNHVKFILRSINLPSAEISGISELKVNFYNDMNL